MTEKEFIKLEKQVKTSAKNMRKILDRLYAADAIFGEEVAWDVEKILND